MRAALAALATGYGDPDCEPPPAIEGKDRDAYGFTRWQIFPRESVESWLGPTCDLLEIDADPADRECMLSDLTGWSESSPGMPGGSYTRAPCMRIYVHAVLVYQRGGWDI